MSLKNVVAEFNRLNNLLTVGRKRVIESKCVALKNELAEATPVDTGLAKSSWQLKSTGNALLPFKIVNDVSYIEYLNEGSSKQAPAHFIEKTALRHGKPVGAIVTVKHSPDN